MGFFRHSMLPHKSFETTHHCAVCICEVPDETLLPFIWEAECKSLLACVSSRFEPSSMICWDQRANSDPPKKKFHNRTNTCGQILLHTQVCKWNLKIYSKCIWTGVALNIKCICRILLKWTHFQNVNYSKEGLWI